VWFLKLPHCRDNQWAETWELGDQTWKLETADWEDVTVPAGTFRAIRIERTELSSGGVTRRVTDWYALDVGRIKWSSMEQSAVLASFTRGK
jgi:hypothetical protein